MTVEVIIARHGNTFDKGETPRRVGSKTDLPLVEKGFQQGKDVGLHLKRENWEPEVILHGPLLRHKQTMEEAIKAAGWTVTPALDESLDEIDYGPDENMTDADVNARLGESALKGWDADGTVPNGWNVDPEAIRNGWKALFKQAEDAGHKRVLIFTSNGTARFVLSVLENDPKEFLKLSPGKLGYITLNNGTYTLEKWNVNPAESA